MYERVKKVVPRGFLLANELGIRRAIAVLYRGDRHECNVCRTTLSRFIRLRDDLSCPRCGSLARNRRLFGILANELTEGLTILDFSPSRALYRALRDWPGIRYVASDFAGEFLADEHYDITKIAAPDDWFDLIVCYHVLEHVEDDRAAMAEMLRVLRPGGRCLIQTPFKAGAIYEDPSVIAPEERRRHFGQEDHVRTYSVEGLADRLTSAGFRVTVMRYEEEPFNRFGLATHEVVLVAQKLAAGAHTARQA